jgi:signal peptidase I
MSFFKQLGCLVLVFAVAFGLTKLTTFVYFTWMVPNRAMEPMIQPGDHLLVHKTSHATPHRGELLVFRTKEGFTLQRVVAVAGDRVKIRQKKLFINELPQQEDYVVHNDRAMLPFRDEFPGDPHRQPIHDPAWAALLLSSLGSGELIVPKGTSFALGDNRDNSFDSRFQGCYPDTSIAGFPAMTLYSVELKSTGMNDPPKTGALRTGRFLKSF